MIYLSFRNLANRREVAACEIEAIGLCSMIAHEPGVGFVHKFIQKAYFLKGHCMKLHHRNEHGSEPTRQRCIQLNIPHCTGVSSNLATRSLSAVGRNPDKCDLPVKCTTVSCAKSFQRVRIADSVLGKSALRSRSRSVGILFDLNVLCIGDRHSLYIFHWFQVLFDSNNPLRIAVKNLHTQGWTLFL